MPTKVISSRLLVHSKNNQSKSHEPTKQSLRSNDLNQLTNNLPGFTLIELLVVISILAVLATIGLINYQDVVKKGRDAKRISDFKQIQAALEQFRNDNFSYPPSGGAGAGYVNFGGSLTTSDSSRTYLKTVPIDPKNTSPYLYSYTSTANPPGACAPGGTTPCASYCLYATLEVAPPSFVTGCSSPTVAGQNYSVSQP